MPPPNDLFAPVHAEARLDPMYVELLRSPLHGAARAFLNDAFQRMGDPDGTFVSNFQGPAFHARLFEITSFAYLETAGLRVSRAFSSPDFMASKGEIQIAVEVTTTNPPDGADRNLAASRMAALTHDVIIAKSAGEFPRRMSAALWKKASKAYHLLPHVAGKPIVVMTQPAFEPGASFYVDWALIPCLYGNGAENSGFFGRSEARAISAVAYCNGFSVSKVWRLSAPAPLLHEALAIRQGHCLLGCGEEPGRPLEFQFEVGDQGFPPESWAEGVTIFLNPNANVPLPPDVLPATCTFARIADGTVLRCIDTFHPVASFMRVGLRPGATWSFQGEADPAPDS